MAKQKKHNLKWIKQTLDLKPDHRWQGTPGYKIFVVGRGAVRIEVPGEWVLEPQDKSFRFLDAPPPNDNSCIEVSYNLLPPGDYRDFPLERVLKEIAERDERNVLEVGEVITVPRQTARIVWIQLKFLDDQENRVAYSRICVGIGSGVQSLITSEFWVEDSDRIIPIWDHVIRSLTLGLYISDPTTGNAMPD